MAFLDGARRTLASANETIKAARVAHSGETAVITLGFVDSSIYGFMPVVLRAFRKQHPSVRVVIRALSSAQQVEALERGDIQVGILRPVRASARLIIEEIARERLIVAVPRGHRLASLDQIHIEDLRDEPMVFFQRDTVPSVYERIMGMFRRAGQEPNIVQEAGEQHTLIALVAAGLGYSITAAGPQYWGTRDVVYRPLAHAAAWIPMGIAWRRAERSEPVSWFVETARSMTLPRAPKEGELQGIRESARDQMSSELRRGLRTARKS